MLFTGNTVNGAYDEASIEVLSLKTGQWKTVQRGGYFGRYLATSNGAGHLVSYGQRIHAARAVELEQASESLVTLNGVVARIGQYR